MEALKGVWEVTAGLIPGQPMLEHTRQFYYTSSMCQADVAAGPNAETNQFTRLLQEAHQYAQSLTQPQYLNWVRLDWIWM